MSAAPALTDRALVTHVTRYGDSDLVVRLFCRERGRVGAFARGAQRSKRRFAGGLAPLSRGTVELERRRGDLFTLRDARLEVDLGGLGADPLAFGRASYLVELIEKLVPEEEPHTALFDQCEAALGLLERGAGDVRVLRAFELKLLGHTGYLPDLAPDFSVVAFDPVRARLLAAPEAGSVPFDEGAREAAVWLCGQPLGEAPALDDEVLRVVGRLFAAHLRRLGIGPLKTVAFLKSLR